MALITLMTIRRSGSGFHGKGWSGYTREVNCWIGGVDGGRVPESDSSARLHSCRKTGAMG